MLVGGVWAGLFASGMAIAAETVRLRADFWMPYNGDPSHPRPGYVVEVACSIFGPAEVDYGLMPWTEALKAAGRGDIEGVIGAAAEEGEGLIFPVEPAGAPVACLVVRHGSSWVYENVTSLRTVRLGVAEGYVYWPGLDRYLHQTHGPERVVRSSGDDPLADLLNQLDAGGIDVLAGFDAAFLWELRFSGRKAAQYRIIYRHEPDPIYIAFAPTEKGRELAARWDAGLKRLRETGELEAILARYGLADWK